MVWIGLLALDAGEIVPVRKIGFMPSLRSFRPVHSTHGLRPRILTSSLRSEEHRPEAPLSNSRILVCRSVTALSNLAPTRLQNGGSSLKTWVAITVGVACAFIVQFIVRKLRRSAKAIRTIGNSLQPTPTASVPVGEDGETVEWVNMCWRKIWRVYQQGLEKWLAAVLQPVFDKVVREGSVPRILKGIKITELTFDHQAPYFTNLRRRTSRKDTDLSGVVDVRYTGGARMLLMLEVGGGKWNTKVPVLVSDLDLECQLWLKIRLAPWTPYLGTLSFAFVGPPNIKVQLSPYSRVRLMQIPVLQSFLTRLLTKVLPGLMVLPRLLDINIPPAITAVAEAAVGRDAVMKAVASAVLQADALEQSLIAVLPLGPHSAAGGITVPKSFQGELSVALIEGRNIPVWGIPWQSNPYCRLTLGKQAVLSKRESNTGTKGNHREPRWNQEFEFLVENLELQVLEVFIRDNPITGRPDVGKVQFPLNQLPKDGALSVWLPVQQINPGHEAMGELHLDIAYKPFVDEDYDSNIIEAKNYTRPPEKSIDEEITDIKSAAAASSKAAAEASAALSAIAMTRAAAARAAHRAQKAAQAARKIANLGKPSGKPHQQRSKKVESSTDTSGVGDVQTSPAPLNGSTPPPDSEPTETEPQQKSVALVQWSREAESNGVSPTSSKKEIEHEGTPSMDSTSLDDNGSSSLCRESVMDDPWSVDIIRPETRTLKTWKETTKARKKKRQQWWMWLTASVAFWRWRSKKSSSDTGSVEGSPNGLEGNENKDGVPVVLPNELPLEEIAKEVVRLKTVTEKDETERMERLYTEVVKRGDRKWIMLLCFLIALSIGMLGVVALRIGPL